MQRRPLRLVAFVAVLVLSRRVAADNSPPVSPPASASSPVAAPGGSFIVASDRGVREVGPDGKLLRTLSRRPAQHPRLTTDRRRVLYLPPSHAALRAISLDTGEDVVVAKLPSRFRSCKTTDDPEGREYPIQNLDVQEDSDFSVDAAGKGACLSLKDRNVNMLNLDVGLYVDLATGKVSHRIEFPSECTGKREIPSCARPAAAAPSAPAAAFPYDLDKGRLVRREPDGKRTKLVKIGAGDFEAEPPSPSGRWAVLLGNRDEGDYIHFDALLLDRQTGKIFPLRSGPAKALSNGQLTGKDAASLGTAGVVGETTRRWLPGRDLLLLDSLLMIPGEKGVNLGGEVAPE